ncbi:hypothetical protein VWT53_11230, partial [Xanthomonas citri pv. citri]|nr:hypothetical protein [Xanthomonas citri pv. citri]MBD4942806.1 hypothetical protein [Xanthomonas citri pv. citri]
LGLLEHGDDLAVGKAGLLHGTSSGKGTRKFHFWRLLMGGGITEMVMYLFSVHQFQGSGCLMKIDCKSDTLGR